MPISLTRRGVLKSSLGLLLADALLPGSSFGAPKDSKRKFVFAYFDGGWDLLLGLDPHDPATTDPKTKLIEPNYGALVGGYGSRGVQTAAGLKFGPAVPPAFLAHAGACSVIRGITMDTAAHEVGRRYFLTGRFPRGLEAVGSSTAAEVVAQVGESTPIAHLSAGVEAYATDLPPYATALSINSLADLAVALTPLTTIDPAIKSAVEAFQNGGPGCEGARLNRDGLTTRLTDSVSRSRAYLEAQLARVFDFSRTDAEMMALISLYGLGEAGGDASAPQMLAFAAGQALKNNISQCVSVQITRNLDTHANWAQDHAPRQEQGWQALAALLTDLKNSPGQGGKTLLDETTVLVFSEFGRTPLMNSIRGRDHFLGNSVLVAGAGLKHGLTVGGTASVGMMPLETDLSTGQAFENPTAMQRDSGAVQILTPKHVLATVLASAGLDATYLRADPIKALLPM